MFGFMRLRRFRTPIVLSIFLVLVFYHFSFFRESASKFSVERLKEHTTLAPPEPKVPTTPKEDGTAEAQAVEAIPEPAVEPIPLPSIAPIEKPSPRLPPTSSSSSSSSTVVQSPPTDATIGPPSTTELERWTPYPEKHPLPKEKIIPLPTGEPKLIPQIQASFAPESEAARKMRVERQDAVKESFLHAWNGYKTYAWGRDELSPVSNKSRDTFGGWGATLVDTLDTLWLMGLEEEFKEAVDEVSRIDFRSTSLNTIPLFETVIRYLGGLLAAYDISGQTYSVLLDKALELGDMLYGSFDTPNRMPLLRYGWHAKQMAEDKRAPKSASVAEMGSLSLEFTRLAQITGNNSYYDAIARITNALELYQYDTTLPGMWPLYVDSSGCKMHKTTQSSSSAVSSPTKKPGTIFGNGPSEETDKQSTDPKVEEVPFVIPNQLGGTGKEVYVETNARPPSQKKHEDGVYEHRRNVTNIIGGSGREVFLEGADGHSQRKRDEVFEANYANGEGAQSTDVQEDENAPQEELVAVDDVRPPPAPTTPTAVPSPPNSRSSRVPGNTCSPQGLAKPPSLREEKYGLGAMADSLYEYFPKEYLLLGGGSDQYKKLYESSMDVVIENLLFRPNVPGDPDILLAGDAIVKLAGDVRFQPTSGHLACFAGGMFALGGRIFGRNEDISIGSKLTDGCVWAYDVMPNGIMPETFKVVPCEDKENCKYSDEMWYRALVPSEDFANSPAPTKTEGRESVYAKREPPNPNSHKPTREEIALKIIDDEQLPQGFLGVNDKRYILRPEAIESVFIMYRVSADKSWQDKGWNMFRSVESLSRTNSAHSAISDITLSVEDEDFSLRDEMESFWLAETLKYYYLLFSEPDLMSLDDYVLNTEAHPFKRPKAA